MTEVFKSVALHTNVPDTEQFKLEKEKNNVKMYRFEM